MFEAIVFDLDGTLIDSRPAILDAFLHVLAAHNIQPRIALSDVRIGPPLKEILQELSGLKDESQLQILADNFKHYYDNGAYRATNAYAGIPQLLEKLGSNGIPCFVATNKRIIPTRLILNHLAWEKYFDDVYSLDRTTPSLPNKTTMLASLLADRSLNSDNTLYVGDTREDEAAARANNMPFAAALWGYGDFLAAEKSAFASPLELLDSLTQ